MVGAIRIKIEGRKLIMSTYVMADLHGRFTELNSLLKKIGFSDSDNLIIAGDICDRGKENYEMLRWMENNPKNVEFIMGNHDEEFIENVYQLGKISEKNIDLVWCYNELKKQVEYFDYYGTIWELIDKHKIGFEQLKKWADIMRGFPYLKELSVNGKAFIVVHAGYMDEESLMSSPLILNSSMVDIKYMAGAKEVFYTGAREEALIVGGKRDTTIITGHTPTISNGGFYNDGKVFRYVREEMNSVIYDIDCGAGFLELDPLANMACIRLEDEAIFYLK